MRLRTSLEFLLLMTALVGQGVVLYVIEAPQTRLMVGLALLAVVVWAAARVGVGELLPNAHARKLNQRRFVRLRSQVGQLLDEIRRLNWMAVDAERGFRNRETASREMDQIEGRLKELIEEIRGVAGEVSLEEDVQVTAEDGANVTSPSA